MPTQTTLEAVTTAAPPDDALTPVATVRTTDVTAVLVAHDGAAWLPDALAALAASTVRPRRVVCVDTGSRDASADQLQAALADGDVDQVLTLPASTGYGAAVAAALDSAPRTDWLWLLHDDCAPAPDALDALLAAAEQMPSAAILGPKVRDWTDPRVLVEVGVTTDRAGHRDTGLERREYDQGQHDAVRDVLAVGTAGALVRRDVWDEVGGLDPALPVFRDDLDLGWRVNEAGHRVVVVPTATVRHVRAATTGRRELDAAPGRPAGIDRRHALFVLLAHTPAPLLPVTALRLLLACLLRTLGFLLTRQVLAARDELRAAVAVLGHPGRLVRARRTRSRHRRVPARELRPLLASRTGRIRARAEALGDWLAGGAAPGVDPLGALGDAGPDDELAELAAASGAGTLRRLLLRPGVALTLGLLAVSLAAERSVLSLHGGLLYGGRLLPVPAGARDLWASYVASWHPTGSSTDAHPSVAALGLLSTLLLGKPWLAVDVLLLASIPIAGALAYVAAGRVTANPVLRAWAGATWALLPVATGAVSQGRLDVAVVQLALPLLLIGAVRLLRGRWVGWRRAWALGVGLALAASFAPALWPLAGGLLVAAGLATRSPRRLAAAGVATSVPAVLLLPWVLDTGWRALVDGPGVRLGNDPLTAADALLLSPDGRQVLVAALGAAALAALLRRDRQSAALAGWALALTGLATATLLSRSGYEPRTALQVAAAGLLLAALVGADRLRTRLAARSFGWRQAVAAVLVAAAGLLPVVSTLAWVHDGADDPLRRGVRPVLPAFARAELAPTPGLRVLVVRPAGGRVDYDLTTARGAVLGDADTPPSADQQEQLDGVVADLLAARGSDAAEALATRSVGYVAVPAGRGSDRLAAVLDLQPGLTRRATGEVLLWHVVAPAGRVTVLPPPTAQAALRGDRGPTRDLLRTDPPRVMPSGREAARIVVGPGRSGRLLVLAEAPDPGGRATWNGRSLVRRTAWGWAQAFELPAPRGVVTIDRDNGPRHRLLTGQAVALGLVLVLAAPGARKRRGLEVVDEEAS